jgi:hypothetical protein
MRAIPIIAIAALAFDAAALAQSAPPPPAGAQQPIDVTGKKQRREDQIVCKDVSTGTMITKHLCMTRGEWDKAQADSGAALDDMRDFQRIRCGGIAC